MLYFNENNNNKIMYFKILSVKKKYIDILLISPESDIIIVLKKPRMLRLNLLADLE